MLNSDRHYQNSTSEPFILAVFLQNKHFQRASLPRIKFQLHLFSRRFQRKNEPFHKKKYQKQCHRIDFLVDTRYRTATAGCVIRRNSCRRSPFGTQPSPRHHADAIPTSIPLITKRLHFEDNASHCDWRSHDCLSVQFYIIIYYFI